MDAAKDMRRKSSFHTPIAPILIVRKVMRRHQQNTEWTITVHRNRHYDIVTFASYLVFHRKSLTKGYVRFLFYHVGRIQSECYPFGIFQGFDRLLSGCCRCLFHISYEGQTCEKLARKNRASSQQLSHHWSYFFVASRGRRAIFRSAGFYTMSSFTNRLAILISYDHLYRFPE